MCRISMPPKNKAMAHSGRKGKALKKQADPPPLPTSELGSEEEGTSVRDLMNMTDMMASLNTRLEAIECDGRKKRKVAFHGEAPATRTADQRLRPPPGLPPPITRPAALEVLTMENVLLPLPTTSRPDYDQPHTGSALCTRGENLRRLTCFLYNRPTAPR